MRECAHDVWTILWKEWKEQTSKTFVVLFLGGLTVMWTANVLLATRAMVRILGAAGLQIVMDTVLTRFVFSASLVLFFALGPQLFQKERQSGTLESLLATPLSCRRVWVAKSLFMALAGIVVSWTFAVIAWTALNVLGPTSSDRWVVPGAPALTYVAVVLPIFCIALSLLLGAANFVVRNVVLVNASLIVVGTVYMFVASANVSQLAFEWVTVWRYLGIAAVIGIGVACVTPLVEKERLY